MEISNYFRRAVAAEARLVAVQRSVMLDCRYKECLGAKLIQCPVYSPPPLSLLSFFDIHATAESAKPSAMEENPPTTDKGTIFVHIMSI